MFEQWHTVRALLLAHVAGDEEANADALAPALARLRHALPASHITLWATAENHAAAASLLPFDALMLTAANWVENSEPVIAALVGLACDAAIIFSEPGASPYAAAYACYLGGIPARLGQSMEFGGAVLSHRVIPASPPLPPAEHHLYLLSETGLDEIDGLTADRVSEGAGSRTLQEKKDVA